MSPRPRHPVSPATVARLRELAAERDRAEEAYRTAVADALKAGASVREVARVTLLSTSTVRIWGEERGWPTPEQREAWTAARIGISHPGQGPVP